MSIARDDSNIRALYVRMSERFPHHEVSLSGWISIVNVFESVVAGDGAYRVLAHSQ